MRTKKLLAALLSSAMVLGTMAVPALADGYTAETLQDALNAGGTVILDADITVGNTPLVVPAGKTVELDLNDHTIQDTASGYDTTVGNVTDNSEVVVVIRNNGNLTISGNGMIKSYHQCVNNEGTLTINGGTYDGSNDVNNKNRANSTIYNTGTMTINGGIISAAEKFAVLNEGTTTVNACTINSTSSSKSNNANVYGYALSSYGGTMTVYDCTVNGVHGAIAVNAGKGIINGGTFTTSGTGAYYAAYIAGERGVVNCDIYGGTFNGGGSYSVYVGNDNDGGLKLPASCQIYGGTFKKGSTGTIYAGTNTGNPSIYGGTFGSDPSDVVVKKVHYNYVADGSIVLDTNDTTYPYEVKPLVEATSNEVLSVLSQATDTKPVTIKSKVSRGGEYEQVTAKTTSVENANFTITATVTETGEQKFYKTVNLSDIANINHVEGAMLCGLIVTNIPDTITLTIE